MNRRIFPPLVAACAAAGPALAQADPSLGAGVGTVRFEGGSSFSSATLTPAIRYTSPQVTLDASGALASLPGGVWSTQGRFDLWGITAPLSPHVRLGAEAIFAGTTRSDNSSTSAAHAVAEVLWSTPRGGVGFGAGPSGGWNDAGPVSAFRTRARAWWRSGPDERSPEWRMTLEPTRFAGAWFTDAGADVTVRRGPAVVSLWAGGRLSSAYGSTGAASAYLQWSLAPAWSLDVGGGAYLRDPYQGLPRAGFVSLVVRWHPGRRAAVERAVPVWKPLMPTVRGDSLVVRFRMPGARSVAIAGEWNAWQPQALHALGDDVWEAVLALPRGLYHFNLLVDDADWVVPNGVAAVGDGLGGMVGVLVAP